MRISRSGFIVIGLTTSFCLLLFVYFKKTSPDHHVLETNREKYNTELFRITFEENSKGSPSEYFVDRSLDEEIKEKLTLLLKGEAFNPIVRKHVEDLKEKGELGKDVHVETVSQSAKSRLQPRDSVLTPKELKNIHKCLSTSKQDYDRNYAAFFGGDHGKLQNIRRTHHKYLNEKTLMIEVGGNWGWDAGNFSKLYNMYYVILEPLTPYTDILEKKFQGNEKVSIYNIGLGSKTERVMVNLEGNNACATTKFSKKNGTVPIYIINVIDFLTDLGIGLYDLDLMTMNCEGCEYEVLETLVEFNLIEKIRNIQWATHTQISIHDPWGRYCRIQELLRRTHWSTYQYKFNWENWRRRDLA
ncbi:uncharacterized protein LOC133186489 [Saccostrea echinata]|uniref:uncharacterized protein LOC133186489 n=1 Tax=Saccostrea echinata TaxID=191078 RepID=UPI002A820E29|nr:uncharacterized protein LOC133186489 [Saccostrea echinata]